MEKLSILIAVVLLGCSALPSCAYMTKSGRSRAAYERYVNKCSNDKLKRIQKYKMAKVKSKPQPMPASQPLTTTSVSDSPQSITSGDENN